jgi:S1-C subfamily serine protease
VSQTPSSDREQHVSGATANGWLVVMLGLLTAALLYRTVIDGMNSRPDYTPRVVTPRGDLAEDEKTSIAIFENASPSVVNVRTKGYRRDFYGRVLEEEVSSGTGIVWDESGYIVTNLHVVETAVTQKILDLEVVFADNQAFDAMFIGTVSACDIAVLRIKAPASLLVPVTIGESHDLRVGQKVLAIGNPFGLDRTLSTGVIGGLDRKIRGRGRDINGMIQTDAAINPGNSGGPLLDSAGRLIGVNTAIVSASGDSAGLGFAVPVQRVLDAVNSILKSASAAGNAAMGITLLDFNARENFLPGPGVIIGGVYPNSPAERSGLRGSRVRARQIELGDLITHVNGQSCETEQQLRAILSEFAVGDDVEVSIIRGTARLNVRLQLYSRPAPGTF